MTATLPLHQRIRTEMEAQILGGVLKPGERIPYEHELMAQYGCSRMTVSRAISALAEAGLVSRHRRGGTLVARPTVQSAVLDIPDIEADVLSRGGAYAMRLLLRAQRTAGKRDDGFGPGVPILELAVLHLSDGEPFALEHRLISLDAVPDAAGVDFAVVSPGAWLLDHVPWTEAEHRIDAAGADPETARGLGLDPGAACLVLRRRTWRGENPVTRVDQIFPAGSYSLVAHFKPTGA